MHELITIRISHYNEKARWALDRLDVPYRESGYMPLFHFLPVAWATRGRADAAADRVSTRYSTPVLVTEDGECICDSSRIVHWASDRYATPGAELYPEKACEEIERRTSERLGEHTRRLAYFWALQDPAAVRALAEANVGPLQARLFSLAQPFARSVLKRVLLVDADHAAQSREVVLEEVAWASERIGDHAFLVDGRFTAADLSLACMLAPALLVSHAEGYGAELPALEAAHPEAAAFARELRETRAGRHALRMFREER